MRWILVGLPLVLLLTGHGTARAAEADVDRAVQDAIKPSPGERPLVLERTEPPAVTVSKPACGPTTTTCPDQIRHRRQPPPQPHGPGG